MRSKIALLTSQKLIQILKENFDIIPPKAEKINVKEYAEGYMNHVFNISFDNSDKKYVVVLYNSMRYRGKKGNDFLSTLSRVTEYLNEKGFNSRRAIKNKNGDYITRITLDTSNVLTNPRLLGVYDYIEGSTLEWDAYTRRHLRSAGMKMSQMHRLLKDYKGNVEAVTQWDNYLKTDSSRMLQYMNKNTEHIINKLHLKFNITEAENLVSLLHQDTTTKNQLVHCDFVRGNILFSQKKLQNIYEITGILDFEKLLFGPIEADISRTMAFLLVDCRYKSSHEIEQYFLTEGYALLGKGASFSISQLNLYMIYYWLRDFWKFLECNPYEDLKKNYHFNKTTEILIEKGFLICA